MRGHAFPRPRLRFPPPDFLPRCPRLGLLMSTTLYSMTDRGEVLLGGKDYTYFLVSEGEVKELPRARRGVRTRYSALNREKSAR